MKSIIIPALLLFLYNYNFITAKEESGGVGIFYNIGIGPNSTKIKMLLSTSTVKNSLFSNSNRKYAEEIHQRRNKSILVEPILFNQVPIASFKFDLKIDPTYFMDETIQGEFGFGINSEGKNELIELLYHDKALLQKEIIIGPQLILDTYLVTEKFYFGKLTDRDDLEQKYHEAWVAELSHILTGASPKEFTWNNTEEINGRAILDSSSKYIFLPENYINLILDILNLNLTMCPVVVDANENKTKYIKCSDVTKNYFANIKPIYFVIDGYACLLKAEELFENLGDGRYDSYIRFRPEANNIWTFGLPFFKKFKVWIKFDKKLIGFHGNGIIDFSKEYKQWREENDSILNKKSNDKKIVVIGATMGSMILLTILFCLCKSSKMENSINSSKFIEERNI